MSQGEAEYITLYNIKWMGEGDTEAAGGQVLEGRDSAGKVCGDGVSREGQTEQNRFRLRNA